ncbi:TetR/AcrR family transcriptional regulator [Actinoallomurus oryzae]
MRSGRARPPLTIAEVATRAELARSVVYNYFADVRSLLVAHAEHETRRFLAELQGALGSAGTATERVTIYVRRQLADFAANPQPAGPELAPLLGPDGYREMHAHVQPLAQLLVDMIGDGIATGEFAPSDPATTATLVHGCLGAERHLLGRHPDRLATTTDRVTTFILRSLGARTS